MTKMATAIYWLHCDFIFCAIQILLLTYLLTYLLHVGRPCLQMSTWTDTRLSPWWIPPGGELWSSSSSVIIRFIITDCPLHQSLHRQQPIISGCCCCYLEQSSSALHLGILTTSFQSSSEDPSLLTVVSLVTVKCPRSDLVALDTLIVHSFIHSFISFELKCQFYTRYIGKYQIIVD